MGAFISFRRFYLDRFLENVSFFGDVLDIGGKKDNKRGDFRPPLEKVKSWKYLNVDASTNPDYHCSAEKTGIVDSSFDIVLMCETLEHLEQPGQTLCECFRLLRVEGQLYITVPFLYPVHADPYDFQRWTPERLRIELEQCGFKDISIAPMGGFWAVIYDLIRFYIGKRAGDGRVMAKVFSKFFMPPMLWLFRKFEASGNGDLALCTGYFVAAKKVR